MELGLEGRVALVTGGSKGIGRACAAGLAAEGCRLALCARGAGGGGEAAGRVVEATIARFGRLDVLVNNAGAIRGGDFLGTPAEQWAEDWRLKLLRYTPMAP